MCNDPFVRTPDYSIDKIRTEIGIYSDGVYQGSFELVLLPRDVVLNRHRLLMVVAKSLINPLDWATQVYKAVTTYLSSFGEDMSNFIMLVDLYSIVGPYEQALFTWRLWLEEGQLEEELKPVDPSSLGSILSLIQHERDRMDTWWHKFEQ
jgi:hypothetical protein